MAVKDKINAIFKYFALYKADYKGKFDSYESARKKCRGYEDDEIIDKVKKATQMVLSGNAFFERDSVTFNYKRTEDVILSYLMMAYLKKKDRMEPFVVLDWGGALGSIYLQHKAIFDACFVKYTWVVIEQNKFVDVGDELFKDDNNIIFLRYDDNDLLDRVQGLKPDVTLLRSTIEYIEDWKDVLEKIKRTTSRYLIIDRLPLFYKELWTVQRVPVEIYDADYPIHLFQKEAITDYLDDEFYLNEDKVASVGANERFGLRIVKRRCLVFVRKHINDH